MARIARKNLEKQSESQKSPDVFVKSGNVNQDMQELSSAKDGDVSFKHTDQGIEKVLENTDFQIAGDLVGFSEKAKQLAFLEEKVVINILNANDDNQDNFVFLQINGEGAGDKNIPWLPRGVDVTVKRKFVEKLMRARPTRYKSRERFDQNGNRTYEQTATSALMYPFITVRDDNPLGDQWRKTIMAERA